jgi:dephospho-CoA kinase
MRVIGITGGIGAGKSRVLYLLKEINNAYVVEADKLAKRLMMPGEEVYKRVAEEFPDAVSSDGVLDSRKLAGIIYSDSDELEKLNGIVHPAVKKYILNDIEEKRQEGEELYFIEAALLIEDGYKNICDEMWYVRTDTETRISRLIEFRGMDYDSARAVIDNQKPDEYYIANSDFVIDNNGSFSETESVIYDRLSGIIS